MGVGGEMEAEVYASYEHRAASNGLPASFESEAFHSPYPRSVLPVSPNRLKAQLAFEVELLLFTRAA